MLDHPARVAIHFSHRIGALVATFILMIMVFAGRQQQHVPMLRRVSLWLLFFLVAQLAIAITMVLNLVPLSLAVAHNAVAALLWLAAVTYLYVVWCRCK
ncbi:MAG: hypothetical protein HKM24_03445 [Gammaproteobacteria bacterium]|nr:hypothetical protein [Gammaproteobacteria bacterium]